jgi:hypothetical protein
MTRSLALLTSLLTALALAGPAAAATGVCNERADLHKARTINVHGARSLRVDLREERAGQLLSLRATGLTLRDAGRQLVLRAGKRRVLSAPVRTRGVRRVQLELDAGAGRVRLSLAGRRVAASRRLVAETSVRVGARVAGGRLQWTRRCAPGKPAAATAPTAAASGCGSCATPAVTAADSSIPTTPFATTSVWKAPLAANAPLDTGSSAYVAELRRQLATTNPWINTTTYSAPVYTVAGDQPRVHVKLDTYSPALQTAFDQVPIPAGAVPAGGGDRHLVIWQPATDTMWEFWLASKQADGWHARWGGRMDGTSLNPGYFTAPNPSWWGATATSLPLMGGLIRIDELRQGHIDHALALAIPHTRKGVWSWPAQRTDGDIDSTTAIPEGARFRLDPTLDIDALKLPAVTAMIAKAVQRYGMILRDKSGSISFYAEDPAQYGTNPYPALFGTWPNRLFDRFPWDRLQVLALDLRH